MEKITIQSTKLNQLPSGPKLAIKTKDGRRYNCKEESLFDFLLSSVDTEIEVEIKDSMIIDAKIEKNEPTLEAPKEVEVPKEVKVPKPKVSEPTSTTTEEMPVSTEIEQETLGIPKGDTIKHENLFPLLRAEEIELRVGLIYTWGLTLLLYKNARCDQERLDQVFKGNWSSEYFKLDGNTFCAIKALHPITGEWLTRTDVGTPSTAEPVKGEVSDAFKRACVAWGSGRELYSAPEITVKAESTKIEKNEKGKLVCKDSFKVSKIAYDKDRNISALEIVSIRTNKVVFKWKKG